MINCNYNNIKIKRKLISLKIIINARINKNINRWNEKSWYTRNKGFMQATWYRSRGRKGTLQATQGLLKAPSPRRGVSCTARRRWHEKTNRGGRWWARMQRSQTSSVSSGFPPFTGSPKRPSDPSLPSISLSQFRLFPSVCLAIKKIQYKISQLHLSSWSHLRQSDEEQNDIKIYTIGKSMSKEISEAFRSRIKYNHGKRDIVWRVF